MRILMTGPGNCTAMQRPLGWLLESGYPAWFVGRQNPSPRRHADNYHFIQALDASQGGGESRATFEANVSLYRRCMTEIKPMMVHAHGLDKETLWCAKAGLAAPLVISVWGYLNALLDEPPKALDQATERIVSAAQALIVESPALASAVRRRYPAGPRVLTIPLGINVLHFHGDNARQRAQWRHNLRIADDVFVLLSARGWGRIYQHDLIVRAFALARPRFRPPVLLAFTLMGRNSQSGEAEHCYREVMQQAQSLGLMDALRVLPNLRHDMMPGLYAMTDAVISYPASDAFPSTLMEAAACQRPIVTARLPSYADTFVEFSSGLVEHGQVEQLADALVEVVNQPPAARQAQLQQTRDWVVEHYDERRLKADLLALYAELVA